MSYPTKVTPDYLLVPREATPEMLAAAASAVLPMPPAADMELAQKAARMIVLKLDTRDSLIEVTAVLSTMPAFYRAMLAAAPSPWIPVSERLPECGAKVLAYYRYQLGNGRRIRAFYASRFTIEDNTDRDVGEGCEERDGTTYINEGWYEENEHDDYYWFVDQPVTHWMSLPAPPREEKAGDGPSPISKVYQ